MKAHIEHENILRESLGSILNSGISPDGKMLLVICEQGYALLHRPGLQIQVLQRLDTEAAVFDSRWIDGELYLLINLNGNISLVKAGNYQTMWSIDIATRQLKRISWSPDNRTLVCVTRFNTIKVWYVSPDLAYELCEWTTYNAYDELGVSAPVTIDGWTEDGEHFTLRIGSRQESVVYVFNIEMETYQSFY